jgi:flagellar protein FliO/FliZ
MHVRPSSKQFTVTGMLLAVATAGLAAAPFAAPAPQVVSDTATSAVRVPLALLLVVAMVLGAAWLMRRATGMAQGKAQRLQLISQLQLGAREKAVLIRVSGQEVLLGVAPGNVRLLLTNTVGAEAAATAGPESGAASNAQSPALIDSFRDILRRSLGR